MANATIRRPRPKYLNLTALLFEIRLPLPGWASILHRISGLLLGRSDRDGGRFSNFVARLRAS